MPLRLRAAYRNGAQQTRGRLRRLLGRKRTIGIFLCLILFLYISSSFGVAIVLTRSHTSALIHSPSEFGPSYKNVVFTSREDHLQLRGWFIPGVLADKQLTAQRAIIVVHGLHANRSYFPSMEISVALAKHGFAVLAFDLRGNGASAPARLSLGHYEQRDVLGALDFLRSGVLPYPELGRPRIIGGWGDSMGGATLLLAAVRAPAIQAIVTDSAFADALPLIRNASGIPPIFLPSTLLAARLLYGTDFYHIRPVNVVAQIAPRPLLLIHGTTDELVPIDQMRQLASAARRGHDAHVQTWEVQGASHVSALHVKKDEYIQRVAAFYEAALGHNES